MARLLVVDDHPIWRRGLRAMLAVEPWVEEVTEAADLAEALRAVTVGRIDLVSLDIGLPDGDGVELIQRLLRACPDVRILMLTMNDDEQTVARALRAGANGYVLKDTDPGVVVDALRTVAGGGTVFGPRIGRTLFSDLHPTSAPLPQPLAQLSPRERELLAGLAAGLSYTEIARRFGVSAKTVRNQASPLFVKLGVADRLQAALLARDAGLTQ